MPKSKPEAAEVAADDSWFRFEYKHPGNKRLCYRDEDQRLGPKAPFPPLPDDAAVPVGADSDVSTLFCNFFFERVSSTRDFCHSGIIFPNQIGTGKYCGVFSFDFTKSL